MRDPLKPTVVGIVVSFVAANLLVLRRALAKVVFKPNTTFSNGYLGSRNDEERSEMRYVMRIAEFSESSKF